MSYDAGLTALFETFMKRFPGGEIAPEHFGVDMAKAGQDRAAQAAFLISRTEEGAVLFEYLFDMTINRASMQGNNLLEVVAQGLRREGQNDLFAHIRLLILRGKEIEEKANEQPAGKQRRRRAGATAE